MLREKTLADLRKIVGPDDVLTDPNKLHDFAIDEFTQTQNARTPLAVVRPHNTQEVAALLKCAVEHKLPVTARGGGTGLCGGAIPCEGGIVLSMEHFNRILEIDTDNLMVTVEAGVRLRDLYAEIEKEGLFFPPHPGEETAMIGGTIATNAGGARTVKYGTLRQFLRGLEVVLPNGETLQLGGKFVKNSTGFNLMHLFVGSEGLLGVFTKATIALLPKPKHTVSLIAPFPSIRHAIRAVPEIIRQDLQPLALEFVENDSIQLTAKQLGRHWPVQAPACLLIVLDSPNENDFTSRIEATASICEGAGSGDLFLAESTEKQKDILYIRSQMYSAMKPWCMEILDIVVPRSLIADHVEAVHRIEAEYGIWLPTYGHAGDGNVHTHIMRVGFQNGKPDFDAKKSWDDLYPVVRKAIHADALDRGGMVSGEHGIGLAKKEYLPQFVGPEQLQLMRGLKQLFDPHNILNPGKVF